VGNLRKLKQSKVMQETVQSMLEVFDATLNGQNYYQLRTNICGESAESVAQAVVGHPATRGLQGPTIAPIIMQGEQEDALKWFNVTIIVRSKDLMPAVGHLRTIGGAQTTVLPVRYVFMAQSPSYQRVMKMLK
jgi:ATP phosphoribosyltransferase